MSIYAKASAAGEPATEKQIQAIINKGDTFGIEYNIPTTKAEATAEFKRLDEIIDHLKNEETEDIDYYDDRYWYGS